MEEEALLICLPKSRSPWPLVPGATVENCAACGVEVWVAPSGKNLPAKHITFVCVSCGFKQMGQEKEPHKLTITPEQVLEVNQYLNNEPGMKN